VHLHNPLILRGQSGYLRAAAWGTPKTRGFTLEERPPEPLKALHYLHASGDAAGRKHQTTRRDSSQGIPFDSDVKERVRNARRRRETQTT